MPTSPPALKACPYNGRSRPELPLDPVSPPTFAWMAALALTLAAGAALRWPGAVARRPRAVLAALAVPTAAAALALLAGGPPGWNLRIDPSTEPLLPAGDPAREVYRQAVADFGDDEVYVIAMETEGLFRPGTLGRLRTLTDRLARFPEVRRVQSLTDVLAFRWDPAAEWIEVGPFLDEIPRSPESLADLRRAALTDPLYRRTLVSEDGRTAAVNVSFRKMSDQAFIASRLDERIRALLDELAAPGVHFHVAGRSHVKARVYHRMLADMQRLIPLALAVVAAGLGLVFGSWRGVLLPLGVVVGATLWTFGAVAWLDRPLTVLTTLLAPMLIAIGSVYGIHAVARHEEEVVDATSAAAAAEATLRHLRLPVAVAGATTMVGFGALCITDVPAVFELGAFSVLGVAAITTWTLLGLPALLAMQPLRPPSAARGPSARVGRGLERGLAAAAGLAARRPVRVLVAWGSLTVLCAAAIPRIEIDTDYLSFFPRGVPVRVEFEAVNRLLAGAVPLFVAFRGEAPGAFREPEALRALERVQRAADAFPTVGHTASLADTLRVMNRALAADDPAAERIPDTRGAVAELLFLAPKGDLDRHTNVDHSRANLVVRTGAVGTQAVRTLAARLEAAVAGAGLPPGIRAEVTGNAILLARSADGIAAGQPRTVGLAVLAIFALVALSFRSLRLGAVAMVPNVVPVVLYFGALGLGAAPLSLPTSLIGSVALGIAVDDTAHFLVRYGRERRRGLAPAEAAALCGRRVGRPIVITSLMLMAGFGVIALSGFATLREFGLLSAATMGACLLTDLVLLPALLIRVRA